MHSRLSHRLAVTFELLDHQAELGQSVATFLTFLAAASTGMDFHELIEIPQGDRRRYHDDVSVIIISLEGRIWRSCV
jgi:hypothetical protein